eukprot:2618489-Heterocapsa_arctica.AAC.1
MCEKVARAMAFTRRARSMDVRSQGVERESSTTPNRMTLPRWPGRRRSACVSARISSMCVLKATRPSAHSEAI